jgi:hypothetical protein
VDLCGDVGLPSWALFEPITMGGMALARPTR